ncbi:ribosomal protein S15P/S13E [Caldisphaera lagunensis DSM 15908]|uniref:Small ribosomal subunit protein uS15 n=1 Tax=Caldisphaera lagunensis (strain DSM 15908 / JCM 11604 / ANMR 0165 / IC-154) TaxID=1056495 RepID=L0AAM2_CALLD|nr:30S ribosomal protein S15 [Caldisphaera lagunensis]AFZ70218.1 ribosomal protein S15P/S13E [Caldisphaera lagunensis DSM 15908]AFZ70474.1 ribosomal protein S15P/S13E [Caldisphaera lagunensis DSM 15908]
MHKNSRRGKSHSIRPSTFTANWITYSQQEVEMIIEELAKKGYTPSQIGLVLRDQFGIPLVKPIIGKKVGKVLEEKNLSPKIPEDLFNLIRKAVNLRRHLNEHPKDKTSMRGLIFTESKIRRLSNYYKKVGKLNKDWVYDPNAAKLLVAGSS